MQQMKPGGLATDIMALSSASGQLVWQQHITFAKGLNALIGQGQLYVVINGYPSALLDSTNIYLVYSVLVTNGPPPAHLVLSVDQPTYTSTYTLYALAFNAQDGSIKWRTSQGAAIIFCYCTVALLLITAL